MADIIINDKIAEEKILTHEASHFVPMEKKIADPDFQVLVNKDLVGDRTLLDNPEAIYNEDPVVEEPVVEGEDEEPKD